MSNLQRFFRNFISLGFVNIVSRLLMGLALIHLMQVLGPGTFGILSYAQATTVYVIIISVMGIDRAGIRDLASGKIDAGRVFSGVIIVKFFQAIVAYGLLLIFLCLSRNSFNSKYLAIFLGFMGFAQILLLEWYFQSAEKMHLVALYRLIVAVLHAGGIYLFIKESSQIFLFPGIQLIATATGIIFLAIILDKPIRQLKVVIDWEFMKRLFRESLVIGMSFVMLLLLYNFDIIILGLYHSEEVVGYYGVAYKLFTFITLPLTVFFEALFPVLVKMFNKSIEQLKTVVGYIDKLAPAVVYPLIISCYFAAPFVIGFFLGERYMPAVLPFRILLISALVSFLNYINSNGLIAVNREKMYFWSLFLAGVSNVILNFIFVPVHGALGAVATTATAEILGAGFAYISFRKSIGNQSMFPWHKKPLTASVLMIICILALPAGVNIIIRIILGFVLYAMALGLMKYITGQDIRMLVKVHPWLDSIASRHIR